MNLAATKATVFAPELCDPVKRKNTVECTISTLESSKNEDQKRYSSWKAYFVGNAFEKAQDLKDRDFIEIKSGKVENNYDKGKEKLWVKVTIFDFDLVPASN